MAQAERDQNFVTTLLAVSSVDGVTPVTLYADPVTHRLLVNLASGDGTVTDVSVVTANGFAGTVANPTTTPAITLSTTVTGVLKGNGTAISAASSATDYAAVAFKTIAVSGQSDVVADTPIDTLTLVGSGLTITTNAATDTITFTVIPTNPGGNNGEVQYNNAGAFGGISGATSNGTTLTITSGRATTDFSPSSNDGASLGTTALGFSDLHLATGAVINWANGEVTLTETNANLLTLAGGDLAITSTGILMNGLVGIDYNPGSDADTDIITVGVTGTPRVFWDESQDKLSSTVGWEFGATISPVANDGAALGTSSLSFSDLFLASGAVINIASSNWVATHTTGILTIGTGTLKITNPTNNATSVVTIDGTQTFTNKTMTASSNVLGGVTMTLGSDANGDIYYRSGGVLTRLAIGAASRVLTVNAGATAPEWAVGAAPVDVQTFTSGSGNWSKPSAGTIAIVECWGGGGSGGKGSAGDEAGSGGGGGGYTIKRFALSSLANSEPYSVGAGGTAQNTASTDGNAGNNSTFGASSTLVTGYGGGGGGRGGSGGARGGGGGGGMLGVGQVGAATQVGGAGGLPSGTNLGGAGGAASANGWFNAMGGGGGGGASSTTPGAGGSSTYGGGGGGGSPRGGSTNTGAGGSSVWGGGGGAAGVFSGSTAAAGTSINGGNGGTGAIDTTAGSGTQPGGGGGGTRNGTSGAGGDGMVRVTVW